MSKISGLFCIASYKKFLKEVFRDYSGDMEKNSEHTDEDRSSQKGTQFVEIHNHKVSKADIFKFIGLIAFFVICLVCVVLIWPLIQEIFEPDGINRFVDHIRGAGILGVGILLALQFIQVVVAFIPGEATQIAAGLIYGPGWGTLIIVVGCIISTSFVYLIVHHLGEPFVKAMVPEDYLIKFQELQENGRLNVIIFILFLIPGLPKDLFTYLVPLSEIRMKPFVIITTIARTPGIFLSAYAASGLFEGNIWSSVAIFVILAAIALVAILFSNKIMQALARKRTKDSKRI